MQLYRRAILQPGLKTRRGFGYLLDSDLDHSSGWNLQRIATSQRKFNQNHTLDAQDVSLANKKRAINYNTDRCIYKYIYISQTFFWGDSTRRVNIF